MSPQLLPQFAIATVLVIATVMIHGFGLALLARMLRGEVHEEHAHHIPPVSLRGVGFTLGIVLALFVLHGIEIWLFALAFLGTGAIGTLEGALYFSSITYATIGYSDEYIDPAWRLVAAFEGIDGIILLGWSTAFFVRLIGRVGR